MDQEEKKINTKKYVIFFIAFIVIVFVSAIWLIYPEITKTIQQSKTHIKTPTIKNKNSHVWVVTIKDPKFHILQIPQPLEYQFEVIVNGKSEIRTLKYNGFPITSYPWVYATLESDVKKQSGVFKGIARIELKAIKGYSGFALWIDGIMVKETSLNHLEYTYSEP